MERRRFLTALGTGTIGALSGCAGQSEDAIASQTRTDTRPPGVHGYPSDICQSPIREHGIYAITEPAFAADWSTVESTDRYPMAASGGLGDDHTVIGIAGDDLARAYPVGVLYEHEIVNDDVGATAGETPGPVIITYCPLCLSGVVASRVVDGDATTFAVTGQLWRPPGIQAEAARREDRAFGARIRRERADDNASEGEREKSDTVTPQRAGNLVMYDAATGSYWSQLLAKAICGPKAGTQLTIVPSTVTTWADWQERHPDTEVLLPAPYSKTTKKR